MNSLITFLSKAIATVFFIGYAPFAPGTFGSLAGLIFVWLLKPNVPWQLIIMISGFIVGTFCAHSTEISLGEKDSKRIVVDEFIGYFVSIAFLPQIPGYLIAAFLLFRFFDIIKPPPIRDLEKAVSGGMGIMLDDMLAGLFTNIILQCWRLL